MSDDMALDSEEEVDVFSLIAGQGETDEDEQEDDAGLEGEIPEDPEELKAMAMELKERLRKRNQSIRTSKKTNHRMQSEIDALREQIAKIEQNTKPAPADQGQRQAELERKAQEWAERVENDPVEAIRYADWKQAQLEQNLGNVLTQFEQRISDQLAELKSTTNPEKLKYSKEIGALKQNPKFASLGDDALIELAKTLKSVNLRPPGSVGGRRAAATEEKKPKVTQEDLRRMGFDV